EGRAIGFGLIETIGPGRIFWCRVHPPVRIRRDIDESTASRCREHGTCRVRWLRSEPDGNTGTKGKPGHKCKCRTQTASFHLPSSSQLTDHRTLPGLAAYVNNNLEISKRTLTFFNSAR